MKDQRLKFKSMRRLEVKGDESHFSRARGRGVRSYSFQGMVLLCQMLDKPLEAHMFVNPFCSQSSS